MAASDGNERDAYTGHVVHETDRAVLFYLDDYGGEMWFPLSVVEVADDTIEVPRWLARDRGLL